MNRSLTLAAVLVLAACGGSSRRTNGDFSSAGSQYLTHGWYFEQYGTKVYYSPSQRSAYVVSRRCAQGPLTLTLHALGKPHEYVYFHWFGGTAVDGKWEVKYAGKTISSSFTTRTETGWVDKRDNAHCVAAPGEAPAAVPGGGGGGSSTTTTTPVPSGGGGGGGGGEIVVFTPVDATPSGKLNTSFSHTLDASLQAGADITFTFWSDQPNDFDGITIFVEQGTLGPADPVKWQAGYDADIKARADSSAAFDAKWKRRNACINLWIGKKEWTTECKAEFGDDNLKEDRRNACWQVWYSKKTWSNDCKTEFGDGPLATANPTSSTPIGKPPAPPADPQPPKPSVNAEWVPGSYSWSGSIWVWSPGFFRVPKADIDSGQTAKAPTAPPPDKQETPPPPPAPGAVWTPGWWSISLSGWVWVGGAWRMPPKPGATWRAFVWVKVQATFVLQPGGWVMP